jgi:AraC-like DNA-binding protein/tetratricopeptide (TPR) repeat protein
MTESLSPDQLFIRRVTDIIQGNLENENFSVRELARESGYSRYGLNRRLSRITNKTVVQFISEVRLQKALEMLGNEENTVSEVAFKTGFSSPAYFSKCFHEFFGYPPGEVKKRVPNNPHAEVLVKDTSGNKLKNQVWRNFFHSLPGFLTLALSGLIIGFFIFLHLHNSERDNLISSDGRISIAVMPFRNMTNDKVWDIWQDAIQEDLITSLSNYPEELIVRQTGSVNSFLDNKGLTGYASLTYSVASSISRKLDAVVFIYGNIQRAGSKLRLDAKLINSRKEEVLKSFEIDGPYDEDIILDMTDSLRKDVRDFLIISQLKKVTSPAFQDLLGSTKHPEALSSFINGQKSFSKLDFTEAIQFYAKAIAIDSNFVSPYIFTFFAYKNNGQLKEARAWSSKVFAKRDLMTIPQKGYANAIYASCFETPNESVRYYRSVLDFDDQLPDTHNDLGSVYCYLQQYDNAIPEFIKTLEIYEKWGVKPFWGTYYSWLALAYHKTGQYKEEKKILKKAKTDFPDDPEIMYWEIVVALTDRDTVTANRIMKKWILVKRVQSCSEARITATFANMYIDAGIPDEAEKYIRQALSLEPENPARMRDLAYFLIKYDRDINEAMELVDKALKLNPDEYIALECKGWGLYKQGRYQEALELLQKSWNLRLSYRHSLFLHLEAAKKAVAENKTSSEIRSD